jgi:hypothetical protein
MSDEGWLPERVGAPELLASLMAADSADLNLQIES